MNDFKFGDIIENGWASNDNPTKRGVFVRYMYRSGKMNPGKHAVLLFDSGGLGEFRVDMEARLTKVGTIFEAAAAAGWNACRRQVYLLSEDYIERTHALKVDDSVEGNFYRGQYDVAKSFAKAFGAFEARDCDYFKQIDFATLLSSAVENVAGASNIRNGHD